MILSLKTFSMCAWKVLGPYYIYFSAIPINKTLTWSLKTLDKSLFALKYPPCIPHLRRNLEGAKHFLVLCAKYELTRFSVVALHYWLIRKWDKTEAKAWSQTHDLLNNWPQIPWLPWSRRPRRAGSRPPPKRRRIFDPFCWSTSGGSWSKRRWPIGPDKSTRTTFRRSGQWLTIY